MTTNSYQSLGVSANKNGLHSALNNANMSDSSGLFVQTVQDVCNDDEYASFMHCDGAGTKSLISYLYCKDTGRIDLFAGLAQDALVMNLDDIFCLGTPQGLVTANTIARNARLINDRMLGSIFVGYKLILSELHKMGIHIQASGGETADCGDIVRTLVVDATIFGRIHKDKIVSPKRISPGDVIVGLSSCGQTTYETSQNSGIGSNGLTLARHSLLSKYYLDTYPESADTGLDSSLMYRGPFYLKDDIKALGMTIGEALASPTRTYAPVLLALHNELQTAVHAVIHNTGGGQTKVLRFGVGNHYIKDNLFDLPTIFQLIQQYGQVEWKEMYQVFNMGHRIEIYVEEKNAQKIIDIAKNFSLDAKIIGHVEKTKNTNSSLNSLEINSKYGVFTYGQD